MLNKMLAHIRKQELLDPGDRIICAVSGGADSMALLWAMYLLKEKLEITVEAAHFNHGLRGQESDRDEAFVRDFCEGYGITCHVGKGNVVAGKKGLEAAARDARYSFFHGLDGIVATAHTADDNAETVLMHLVRGTGLKGLGAISPRRDRLIRPMLTVTREDVLAFLGQYYIAYVNDSSNDTDDFLRNRLRHHVMPLLRQENPQFSQNMSAMAMELRQDEEFLQNGILSYWRLPVAQTNRMEPPLRRRTIAAFLQRLGVREPERSHVELCEKLLNSDNPSATADFPGNIRVRRNYDVLEAAEPAGSFTAKTLEVGQVLGIRPLNLAVVASYSQEPRAEKHCFVVSPVGEMVVRPRQAGDKMRLAGGTKTLKKLFIDRKIPEHERLAVAVIADDLGVLGVQGIGPNLDRLTDSGVQILIEEI